MIRRVNSPVNPSSASFRSNSGLFIDRIWDLTRLREKSSGRHDLDPLVAVDDPGPECDRRNVSFAGGAQAEDKTQRAGREIRLVRVRNDGRIEQRRGLQRILGQEIGSDQQLPCLGKSLFQRQQARGPVRIAPERDRGSVGAAARTQPRPRPAAVPTWSSGSDRILRDNPGTRSVSPGLKGPQKNAGLVGLAGSWSCV